jgi:DinB superfamily
MEKDTLITQQIVSAWQGQIKRIDALIDKLSDEQLFNHVAPGRNRSVYLLGHLATVSDMMLPLLGLGNMLKPEMQAIFVNVPDNAVKDLPSISELRKYWKEVNDTLNGHFNKMTPGDWLAPHTAVSEEDFKKQPHRNKLSIILSRTSHHSYHFGQLAFLQSAN